MRTQPCPGENMRCSFRFPTFPSPAVVKPFFSSLLGIRPLMEELMGPNLSVTWEYTQPLRPAHSAALLTVYHLQSVSACGGIFRMQAGS